MSATVPGFGSKNFDLELNPFGGREFTEMAHGRHDRVALRKLLEAGGDEPGLIVWDVGAHQGYTSLMLATHPKVARVVAFEPHPDNYARLVRNASLPANSNFRVDPVQAAMGNIGGQVPINVYPNVDAPQSTGGYLSCVKSPLHASCYSGFKTVTCAMVVGDDEIARGTPAPHLLKIDVEGAESLVLGGLAQHLQEERPPILLEVHGLEQALECGRQLERYGYRHVETVGVMEMALRCHVLATY